MRRIMENIMITLPVGAILFLPHRLRPELHLSVDGHRLAAPIAVLRAKVELS